MIDIEDAVAGSVFGASPVAMTDLLAIDDVSAEFSLFSSVWTVSGTEITFSFLLILAVLDQAVPD